MREVDGELSESHFVVGMHQGPALDLSFLEKGAARLKWAGFTWVLWAPVGVLGSEGRGLTQPLDGPASACPTQYNIWGVQLPMALAQE